MEKVIFLPKLFAAMTVAKLLPAVSLPSRLKENRQRFLVYATKQVNNLVAPIEWIMEAHNQQVYGNIPSAREITANAIIGYVDVKNDPYIDTSIWGKCLGGYLYRIVRAQIFDTPLCVPQSLLGSSTINQIVAVLPSHQITVLNEPIAFEAELSVPVCEKIFRTIPQVGKITLDLCGDLIHRVLDKNGELRQFTHLALTCGNRQRDFEFCGEITTDLNDENEPVLYRSISQSCGKDIRRQLVLYCTNALR